MRIGLVSDIHGNVIALERCLDFLADQRLDKLCCLGDMVGYYPDGALALERLQACGAYMLLGNHEAMLRGTLPLSEKDDVVYRLRKTAATLTSDMQRLIAGLVPRRNLEAAGQCVVLMHGGPADPLQQYVYPDTDPALFADLDCDFCVTGHSHHPFVREHDGRVIVNVGSVGLPRDVGNLACCAVLDLVDRSVEIFRLRLDEAAIRERYALHTHRAVIATLDRRRQQFVGTLVD